MTHEEKVQKLTGATAAVIGFKDSYFYHFTTISTDHAEEMLTSEGYRMGVSAGGNLWLACPSSDTRWVFADKSLAVIANA